MRWAALALALLVLAAPSRADAQVELVIATGAAGGVILLGGVTSLIGNAVYTGRGVRSPAGWRVTGWIFGSFNVLAGAVPLALGITDDNDALLGIGIGSLSLAAAVFGVAGYATSLLPEDSAGPHWQIQPVVLNGPDGPAFGAGFSLLGF